MHFGFTRQILLDYVRVDGDILTKKFMENLLKGPCYGHTCNQLMSLRKFVNHIHNVIST